MGAVKVTHESMLLCIPLTLVKCSSGIVIGNSMMGEITPAMAEAILAAPGERILLPMQQDHFFIAGLEQLPLAKMTDKAIEIFKERLKARREI
jgi:hypothetical protein